MAFWAVFNQLQANYRDGTRDEPDEVSIAGLYHRRNCLDKWRCDFGDLRSEARAERNSAAAISRLDAVVHRIEARIERMDERIARKELQLRQCREREPQIQDAIWRTRTALARDYRSNASAERTRPKEDKIDSLTAEAERVAATIRILERDW